MIPPPSCKNNALVRAAGCVLSAVFETMSYFALYEYPPSPAPPLSVEYHNGTESVWHGVRIMLAI